MGAASQLALEVPAARSRRPQGRSHGLPWRLGIPLLLVLPGLAQESEPSTNDLRAALRAALAPQARPGEFAAVATKAPIAELLHVLAGLRVELAGQERRLQMLIGAREAHVQALWREHPDQRLDRAAAFAFWQLSWEWKHAHGDAAERADVEAVAAWLMPESIELTAVSQPGEEQGTAERLRRLAVAGQRDRGARWRAALSDASCSDDLGLLLTPSAQPCSAHAFVDLLRNAERPVRARALLAMRRLWLLPAPRGVADAVLTDGTGLLGDVVGQMFSPYRGLQDSEVARVAEQLARRPDQVPWPRLADGQGLSAVARQRLSEALLANLDPDPVPPAQIAQALGQPLPQIAADHGVSLARVVAAASLGAAEYLHVLHRCAAEPGAKKALLLAGLFLAYSPSFDVAAPCGMQVVGWLDSDDAVLADLAALFADRILADQIEPVLANRVVELAVPVLRGNLNERELAQSASGFVALPHFAVASAGRPARLVATAVRVQDHRLVEPLLAVLTGARGKALANEELAFFTACLAGVAGQLDAGQAARAHEWCAASLEAGRGRADTRLSEALAVLRCRLFAVVPDALLPSYEDLLGDPLRGAAIAEHDDLFEVMPPARARRVWPLRFPEPIVAALQGDAAQRSAAWSAVAKEWQQRRQRLLTMVRAGHLPLEIVAATVPYENAPTLPELAEVLPPHGGSSGSWSANLANAIAAAPAIRPETDLEALRRLAECVDAWVGSAVCRRAASMGEGGRAIAAAVINREVGKGHDATVIAFAGVAMQLGITPTDPLATVARLRQVPSRAAFADAFAVRFGGLDLTRCPSSAPLSVLVLAQSDVDVATLRVVVDGRAAAQLPKVFGESMLRECSDATAAAALELAAELPLWSSRLQAAVLRQTLRSDPRVRLAAYRALHTRDAGLWACAWLAYEAEFDPDPEVRAFAASLPR